MAESYESIVNQLKREIKDLKYAARSRDTDHKLELERGDARFKDYTSRIETGLYSKNTKLRTDNLVLKNTLESTQRVLEKCKLDSETEIRGHKVRIANLNKTHREGIHTKDNQIEDIKKTFTYECASLKAKISSLTQRLNANKRDMSDIRKENESNLAELETSKRKLEVVKSKIKKIGDTIKKDLVASEELKETNETLTEQNENLNTLVKKIRKDHRSFETRLLGVLQNIKTIKEISPILVKHPIVVKKLSKYDAFVKTLRNKLENDQRELSSAHLESSGLRRDIKENNRLIRELDAEKEKGIADLAKAQASLELRRTEHLELTRKSKECETIVKSLRVKNSDLVKKLKDLTVEPEPKEIKEVGFLEDLKDPMVKPEPKEIKGGGSIEGLLRVQHIMIKLVCEIDNLMETKSIDHIFQKHDSIVSTWFEVIKLYRELGRPTAVEQKYGDLLKRVTTLFKTVLSNM